MTQILLLRHAEAAPHAPQGDIFRPLSAAGRDECAHIGEWLRRHKLAPDWVAASTAQRTRETAALVLALQPSAHPPQFDEALYNGDAARLWAALASGAGERRMLVGHNPAISDLACVLTALADPHAVHSLDSGMPASGMPTCGLAVFETKIPARADLNEMAGAVRFIAFVSPKSASAV